MVGLLAGGLLETVSSASVGPSSILGPDCAGSSKCEGFTLAVVLNDPLQHRSRS